MESGKRKSKSDKQYSLFSQRLQMRRNELGLTQDALSEKAGELGKNKGVKLLKSQIGKYETLEEGGDGFPSFAKGILLAETLECSLDWLYGIPESNTPSSGYSDTESVEITLLKILRAILEEEITGWRIDETEVDKKSILVKNNVLEAFISEYQGAIELEDTIIEKFGDGSSHLDIVTGRKEEIWTKYVQKIAEMKEG